MAVIKAVQKGKQDTIIQIYLIHYGYKFNLPNYTETAGYMEDYMKKDYPKKSALPTSWIALH